MPILKTNRLGKVAETLDEYRRVRLYLVAVGSA
jgi:hypothetical protein